MPLCFDLDGTLGLFGGGYLLLREALGDLWGEPPTAAELALCQGSTDWEIVDQLYAVRFGGAHPGRGLRGLRPGLPGPVHRRLPPPGAPATPRSRASSPAWPAWPTTGHRVWLVSGNTPSVLDFKARCWGWTRASRAWAACPAWTGPALILKALEGGPGPHLYVGDRPHDRLAAERAGVPFLGVGGLVPGDHPILGADAEAEHLVQAVEALLGGWSCRSLRLLP